jgi:hypothetical protein
MRIAVKIRLVHGTVSSGIMIRVFQRPARPPPRFAPSWPKRTRMSWRESATLGGSRKSRTVVRSRILLAYPRRGPLIAAQGVFV